MQWSITKYVVNAAAEPRLPRWQVWQGCDRHTRLRASSVRMLCVQMLRLTRYCPTPWMRIALQAALASQSFPIPKMITSVTVAPRDLRVKFPLRTHLACRSPSTSGSTYCCQAVAAQTQLSWLQGAREAALGTVEDAGIHISFLHPPEGVTRMVTHQ